MDDITQGHAEFGPRASKFFDLVGLIPIVLVLGSIAIIFVYSAITAVAEEGRSASFSL